MELHFSCPCGERVRAETRHGESGTTLQTPCEACNAVYAITITRIKDGD